MKPEIFKIVLTGPESSGKTTLAASLAAALDTIWTPEFARTYLSGLARPYKRSDLPAIARGQQAWENWHAARADRYLVCDTDWTVVCVWDQYRFAIPAGENPADSVPRFQNSNTQTLPACALSASADKKHSNTLYLLCAPDFPWQPDQLREHPEEQEPLFELYETLLLQINARYVVLRGNEKVRLQTALRMIAEWRPV